MQLNFTFFLQIFNFAITYWFLNSFMFKPVIAFIKKRKQAENKINKSIEKKEQTLLKLEKDKDEDLMDFKLEMRNKYNVIPFKEANVPSKILCKINKEEVASLTEIAKKILVERVPHVD